MTYAEFKEFVDGLELPDPTKNEILKAGSDYGDGAVERAEENYDCGGNCAWATDPDDFLTREAYYDLDECIRAFDSDPKTAKYLLSRALKEIPGAPKWLD